MQMLPPSWQWETSGSASQSPFHNPRGTGGRINPGKSDGSKNQAWGPSGVSRNKRGEARERAG